MCLPESPGQLNYMITTLIGMYLKQYKLSYHRLNEVIGVLECVKAELIRRVLNGYEMVKTNENGDIPFYNELLRTGHKKWESDKV